MKAPQGKRTIRSNSVFFSIYKFRNIFANHFAQFCNDLQFDYNESQIVYEIAWYIFGKLPLFLLWLFSPNIVSNIVSLFSRLSSHNLHQCIWRSVMKTGLPMSVLGLFTVINHKTCQQYPCKILKYISIYLSSQWVSEWQGHLLSCSGHLKRRGVPLYTAPPFLVSLEVFNLWKCFIALFTFKNTSLVQHWCECDCKWISLYWARLTHYVGNCEIWSWHHVSLHLMITK